MGKVAGSLPSYSRTPHYLSQKVGSMGLAGCGQEKQWNPSFSTTAAYLPDTHCMLQVLKHQTLHCGTVGTVPVGLGSPKQAVGCTKLCARSLGTSLSHEQLIALSQFKKSCSLLLFCSGRGF